MLLTILAGLLRAEKSDIIPLCHTGLQSCNLPDCFAQEKPLTINHKARGASRASYFLTSFGKYRVVERGKALTPCSDCAVHGPFLPEVKQEPLDLLASKADVSNHDAPMARGSWRSLLLSYLLHFGKAVWWAAMFSAS